MLIGCNWKEEMCCSSQEGKQKRHAPQGASSCMEEVLERKARQGKASGTHVSLMPPACICRTRETWQTSAKIPVLRRLSLDKGNGRTKLSQDPA